MATIRKQSIYSSLFIYAGFAIGALNVMYFFPTFFTPEQFGLTRIIMDIALIFATICSAGALPITFKFSPYYQHHLPKEKNDLMTMILLYTAFCCVMLILVFPYITPWALRKFGKNSPYLIEYFHYVLPLTISLVVFAVLEVFTWMIKKTIVSNFLKEFLFRLLTTLLIVLWIMGIITDFKDFAFLYSCLQYISAAVLVVVLYKSKVFAFQLKPSNLTKRLSGIMIKFGSAYFLSAVLNIIAKTNDTLIIASQSTGGLVDTAIFTIATYLITVMDVPQRSLISASILQISEAWKNHDMEKLDRLYKKTALNLLIFAAGIMGVIIINSSLLLHILGPTYKLLPMLMLILGFSKLIDLGTGLNSQILQLSKHWKIDLFTNMFFVVISIILNYFLTRKLGIIGTAIGGLIAIICYNLIRFIYIKRIYKLQPFTYKNAVTIGAAASLMGLSYLIPSTSNIWVDGIIKTGVFAISFAFFIIKFNISIDLTELYQTLLKKVKR